jgi:sec-independent protein translocase protein TatB
MFDIGWSELVVIGVVALIAIGPKELPAVLRTVGQWMGKMRRMAAEFQGQFQEAMREAEMAEMRKQFDDISKAATDLGSGFDPVTTARNEIKGAIEGPTTAEPGAAPITGTGPAAATEPGVSPSVSPPPADIPVPLPEPAPPVTSADIAPPPAEAAVPAEQGGGPQR